MSIITDLHGERPIVTDMDAPDLTILYGSQTGNAEYLAYQIHGASEKNGDTVALASLEEWLHSDDRALRRLLVVTSTHDNGHMPDNAAEFWEWIQSLEPGALAGMPYAVLSIGDSMYDDFCKAGHDIDGRLHELGAVRVVEGVDCDIDFEFTATKWAKPAVADLLAADPWTADAPTAGVEAGMAESTGDSDRRYLARVSASQNLSKPGSAKEVVHYELTVDDGGFAYEPGDSISVFVTNPPRLVEEWIAVFGDVDVTRQDATRPLREVLAAEVELRLVHPGLIAGLARLRPDNRAVARLAQMLQTGDRDGLEEWLWGRDVLDVLTDLDCRDVPAEDVLDILRPLQHRDYSIASSPVGDDGRVHLTVNGVRYDAGGRSYAGAATSFLRERAVDGSPFEVRRVPAHEFRLPAADVPVIMVGPGVGVAPFRAFLRHRDAVGAGGRNWLFFGDQHRAYDFLYEDEFADLSRRGTLTHLDLAFSRDQADKHYVQDEIRRSADELRDWVAQGGYIYVCGDKVHMAPDVDRAFADILGGDAAVDELKVQGRYVKDVY
ncbi:diflavin oxidoreductase [Microbacterium thalassium]|uniref:Sulfite reductase (NADPH) flavoprotein alpha-component n=1 Tax=Microbacterium thalassium TaxID=362649 RepID=A0A7X0FM25_9MICO|nr:sulfite reductase flavoprotein subunit alpha [Microbacterium thalassium]MBB6389954.1 sulfite reductase (NADPH) flavoprotein alpha-component [Microbacterium thalassium]GLK24640.1 putative sulfite reductase [Microbacterium thalassium]